MFRPESMQKIIHNLQNGTFKLQFHSGKVLFCNDGFAQTFGMDSADECIGRLFDHSDFLEAGLYERLKAGLFIEDSIRNFQGSFFRNGGEEFRGMIDAWYLADEDVIEGIFYDLSNIEKEKSTSRHYELLYRSLIEIIDQAYVKIIDGTIVEANERFARMFDISRDSGGTASRKLLDIVSEKHIAFVAGKFDKLSPRNKNTGKFKFTARQSAGSELEVEASFVWLDDRDGRVLQGLINDNLEIAILEHKLSQSQKMEAVGQLAGGVAHDFNNLLTAIIGHTDLAIVSTETGRDPKYDLEVVHQAADKASILTRQLLTFSRKQKIEMRILCLNALLTNMDKMLRRIIGEDVDLISKQDEDLQRVNADPGQLEQIVVNLAVNSRDAMPSGGKLIIATKNVILEEQLTAVEGIIESGSYVRLTIEDNGGGMSEEVAAKAFDPFYTTKPEGKGTGLGLSTVRDIVIQNGGKIRLHSELEKGTKIEIYFPMILDEAEDYSIKSARAEMSGGTESILVVEDEESVRDYSVKLLKMLGYSVIEAKNGQDAIEIYQSPKINFDLVLSDLIMPDMNGVELTKALKEFRPVKIIFMSGYRSDSFVHEILDPETPYIQKPFHPTTLAKKIREVLDR